MAKTKTKKEKIVDLKPEKIKEEELLEIQNVINGINRAQLEMGSMETKKHSILHHVTTLQEKLGEIQIKLEKEYGTSDINIQDGVINYQKENGEVNKED